VIVGVLDGLMKQAVWMASQLNDEESEADEL